MSANHATRAGWRTRARWLATTTRRCWICQQPGADTVDHAQPLAHGGTDQSTNWRPAHRACNQLRSDDTGTPGGTESLENRRGAVHPVTSRALPGSGTRPITQGLLF